MNRYVKLKYQDNLEFAQWFLGYFKGKIIKNEGFKGKFVDSEEE